MSILLRHNENNHRYFLLGSRIHAVKPNVFDAHYRVGTLVFVKSAPVRELESGRLISMATSGTHPLTYSNERFVEFQEEFFGRSLHGIVTENTLARDRLPLRAGRYIGVPYMGIPVLGSVLVWMGERLLLSTLLTMLIVALSVTALILFRNRSEFDNLKFPKKNKR